MDLIFLEQLRARSSDPDRSTDDARRAPARAFPPIGHQAIAQAESRLGLVIPVPLREIYLSVGNGGFGPAYGILGLVGGATNEDGLDAVGVYQRFRQPDPNDHHWRWPTSLLPIGHLGCGMFVCADCATTDAALIWFEPNPHEHSEPWHDAFIPFNISLETWLRHWLDGSEEDLFEAAWTAKFGSQDVP